MNTNETFLSKLSRLPKEVKLIVSCFSILLIPIISRLHDISLTYGLATSAGILFMYAFLSFLFGRKIAFGKKYLTNTIEAEA